MATGQTYKRNGQDIDMSTGLPVGQKQPGFDAITSESLAQTPTVDFQTYQEPPIPSIASLSVPETKAQETTDYISQLNQMLAGQSETRNQAAQEVGLNEKRQAVTDLSGRLTALQQEQLAIPLQLQQESEGRGRTKAGVAPLQTGRLRENAIKALSTSALLQAAQGNLTLAQSQIDDAVKAKYEPIKEQIAIATANLDLLLKSPVYTETQKARATAQKQAQDAKLKAVEKQEADEREKFSIATTAAKYGASAETLQKINDAKTPAEALLAAGSSLQDPKAQYEIAAAQLENELKRAQIEKTRREAAAVGEKTPAEIKAEREALKNADAQIPVLEDKIDLIDSILSSTALSSTVGTTRFSRAVPGALYGSIDRISGETGNLIAGVEQLTAKEWVSAVLSMKAQGGTLGALNEKEGEQLNAAATKLRAFEVRDEKTGKVVGYNTSEKIFKEEIARIKRLTNIALTKARGTQFADDETALLDKAFGGGDTILPGASFYPN